MFWQTCKLQFAVCLLVLKSALSSGSSPSFSVRIPRSPYVSDWDEDDDTSWKGSGREYSLFNSQRGGARSNSNDNEDDDDGMLERYRQSRYTSSNRYNNRYTSDNRRPPQGQNSNKPEIFQAVQNWWSTSVSPSLEKLPKIICRVEPTTTLKLRKTFRPLKTIVRVGADFNTQLGVWQFRSSWEDAIIGGKLTLAGKELQLSKSWQLSVGK
jgi:hypothetical protein